MSDEVKKISDLAAISADKKAAMGVSALSDTPNRTSRYGTGNLTPTELKNWFDQLVGLAIDRINEIITVLKDGDLASEIPIIGLDGILTVQALAKAVTSGDLWKKLQIAYTDADGNDAKMPVPNKIEAIEGKFANYVVSVGYDATSHKITFKLGNEGNNNTSIETEIVDKSYFEDLIDPYAKLSDPEQNITAQNIEATYVQAETPDGDGDLDKYLVNLKTLNAALLEIKNDVETAIDQAVSSVYVYKGSVTSYGELPKDASNGHVYNVESEYDGHPAGTNYVWSDGGWEVLTGFIDTSKFLEKRSGETKRVYTVDSEGKSSSIGYDESVMGETIPVRDTSGHVKTATPAKSNDAATKGYVDAGLAEKAESFEPYEGAMYTIGAKTEEGQNVTVVVNYGTVAGVNTIPLYSQGKLSCAEPTLNTDAVNLEYLNKQFSDIATFLGKFVDGGIL